jgi:acetyl esterase/lipase
MSVFSRIALVLVAFAAMTGESRAVSAGPQRASREPDIVQRVHGPDAILFVPRNAAKDRLIVYCHKGLGYSVGDDGDWVTDIFLLGGAPTVALNYAGSRNRALPAPAERLETVFTSEVLDSIRFSHAALGGGPARKIVLASDGMGSLVVYSALLSARLGAAGVVLHAPVVEPESLMQFWMPSLTAAETRVLRAMARQFTPRINPYYIVGSAIGTPFLYVHGRGFRVQDREIRDFLSVYNRIAVSRPAELAVFDHIGDYPRYYDEYNAIAAAVHTFLAKL